MTGSSLTPPVTSTCSNSRASIEIVPSIQFVLDVRFGERFVSEFDEDRTVVVETAISSGGVSSITRSDRGRAQLR